MSETVVVMDFERRLCGRRLAECGPSQACGGMRGGSSSSRPGCLVDGLVGLPLPDVVLETVKGSPRCLSGLADVVVYAYPGDHGDASAEVEQARRLDALQHRAFRASERELRDLGFGVVGVSSECLRSQGRALVRHRISHELLSDPGLLLARGLGLPTLAAGGGRCYERLTLVVIDGHISKVFFPVTAARSAAQVIAWIRTRGVCTGVGDDAC